MAPQEPISAGNIVGSKQPTGLKAISDATVDKTEEGGTPVHPTITIPLLNFIDMFSVALVVPLLNQYYQDAGTTSASFRELLNSLFSGSQIVGSLAMGALSDSGILSRKHILYISFLGSALSYSLIVYGGIRGLILSRAIVGGVKQTFTISTSMISSYTSPEERTTHIGRLGSCSVAAFIVGPAAGAYLYKNVDKRAPALLASALFVFNFLLARILLPNESHEDENLGVSKSKTRNKFGNFIQNFKECFSSQELGAVIMSTLIFGWISRATSYASLASFYEEMFGLETYQRGYLRSYQGIIGLLFQTFSVQSTLKLTGGEHNAICAAMVAITITTAMELRSSIYFYLLVVCPVVVVANSLLRLSLQSLMTQISPKKSLSSVLAALDILQNIFSVSVPFYRTFLFNLLSDENNKGSDGIGDPNPILWLKCSILHWFLASVIMMKLLRTKKQHSDVKKNV